MDLQYFILFLNIAALGLVFIFSYENSYFISTFANENTAILPIDMLIDTDSPIIGNISAPITMFEFSDFQCPMCARYAQNTEPEIIENYVLNGKVRIVFKHFPILGPDSTMASLVSQCVNKQGKFWDFYKILYNNQEKVNSGWSSLENLIKFASYISDIKIEKLRYCVDSKEFDSIIQKDFYDAINLSISGTPSFLIVNSDGSKPELITGSQPFPSFQTIISNKLAEIDSKFTH